MKNGGFVPEVRAGIRSDSLSAYTKNDKEKKCSYLAI